MRKTVVLLTLGVLALSAQPKITPEKEAAMKADLAGQIDAMKKQAQVMVDSVLPSVNWASRNTKPRST